MQLLPGHRFGVRGGGGRGVDAAAGARGRRGRDVRRQRRRDVRDGDARHAAGAERGVARALVHVGAPVPGVGAEVAARDRGAGPLPRAVRPAEGVHDALGHRVNVRQRVARPDGPPVVRGAQRQPRGRLAPRLRRGGVDRRARGGRDPERVRGGAGGVGHVQEVVGGPVVDVAAPERPVPQLVGQVVGQAVVGQNGVAPAVVRPVPLQQRGQQEVHVRPPGVLGLDLPGQGGDHLALVGHPLLQVPGVHVEAADAGGVVDDVDVRVHAVLGHQQRLRAHVLLEQVPERGPPVRLHPPHVVLRVVVLRHLLLERGGVGHGHHDGVRVVAREALLVVPHVLQVLHQLEKAVQAVDVRALGHVRVRLVRDRPHQDRGVPLRDPQRVPEVGEHLVLDVLVREVRVQQRVHREGHDGHQPVPVARRSRSSAVMHVTPELEELGSNPGGVRTQCARR